MSQPISRHGPSGFGGAVIRPGWPELLSGIAAFAAVGFGGGALLVQSGWDQVTIGLALSALSGIAGLVGFAVAAMIRLRSWEAFGVRSVSLRWLFIGLGAGVLAFAVKGLAIMGFVALTGLDQNPQDIFVPGASGGTATLILATLLMGVLTPVGEEFLFRGVVTNALLRYGSFIGVVGGALLFALLHGLNMIFPAALVAGLIAGELFRRSGSIWPPVMVHIVFNLPTIPLMVLTSAGQ